MTAETIASVLGGHRAGPSWMARCPAHDDRTPSLSLRDTDEGYTLAYCHAGCTQAEVVAALRACGLWTGRRSRNDMPLMRRRTGSARVVENEAGRRQAATRIWQAGRPAAGTLVHTYLAARGIDVLPPRVLRFHAALAHPSGERWPAMVALVAHGLTGEPMAVHRTFLRHDGGGKAPVTPQKMLLGPCREGAVQLASASMTLRVGEGIETCLAAMSATGRPAWAALSAAGLQSLRLPLGVQDVIVLADNDEAGEKAAHACARRWKREGRRVRIAWPPRGMDFNDLLKASHDLGEEAAS